VITGFPMDPNPLTDILCRIASRGTYALASSTDEDRRDYAYMCLVYLSEIKLVHG
jgi:hypothetical protein